MQKFILRIPRLHSKFIACTGANPYIAAGRGYLELTGYAERVPF